MKRALLVLTALVGLAGCSGSDPAVTPTALPPLSPAVASPTVSPPPSAVPVVTKPPEADAATAAGAEAFARYWMAVADQAFATLDSAPLDRISGHQCATCQSYIESIERSSGNRERYDGGRIAVEDAAATPLSGRSAVVLLTYDVTELRVYDERGALIDTVPAKKRVALNFTLQRTGSGWIAKQLLRA